MQPDKAEPAAREDWGATVAKIAGAVARLDPGAAAALRRDPGAGTGAPAFWKICADCGLTGGTERENRWAAFVQCVALITPKGDRANRESAHQASANLGAALRGEGETPAYSEARLMRLLGTRWDDRPAAALRLARWLAAKDVSRVDLRPLAAYLIFNTDSAGRQIAREYYSARRKQDSAA